MVGVPAISGAGHLGHCLLHRALVGGREVGIRVDLLLDLRGREDQRVVGDLGIGLLEHFLGALDRRDVVHVRRQLRRHLRLVEVIHHRLGRVRMLDLGGHEHVVVERDVALLEVREAQVGVVALQLDEVAGVGESDRDVALGEIGGVVVAGEAAELAGLVGLVDLRDGAQELVDRGLGAVDALAQQDRAGRVVGLGQHRHAALVLRVEEVLDRLQLAPGLLDVVAHPGGARLIRERELAVGVVVDRRQVADDVLRVRDVLLVDRLRVTVADPAGGHVVGEHDEVTADRLAVLELLADLPEELVVVVDVLEVADLPAVLLVEGLQELLVHVERPVGEGPVPDLRLGMADRHRRLGVVLLRLLGCALDAAARGDHGRQAGDREPGAAGAAEEAPSGQTLRLQVLLQGALEARIGHTTVSLATTKVCWGSQASWTSRPGPSDSGSAPSRFWAKTVSSSPPAARMTYWIETPRNEATMTVPRSTFWPSARATPAGERVTFSGRTPIRTASVPCGPMRSDGTWSVAPSCVSTAARPLWEARRRASTRLETPRKFATNSVRGRS